MTDDALKDKQGDGAIPAIQTFYAGSVNLVGDAHEVSLYLQQLVHRFDSNNVAKTEAQYFARIIMNPAIAKGLAVALNGYVDFHEKTFGTVVPSLEMKRGET